VAIYGVGIDLIRVERIRELFNKSPEKAMKRLFTGRECDYCLKKRDPAPCFAMRFSAKEAFAKALGTGIGKDVGWKDVEVVPDNLGKPEIRLSKKLREYCLQHGIISWHLSLTDDGEYGAALVVLEKREEKD